MVHKIILKILLVLLFVSCSIPDDRNGIFFGGQIINPSSRSVTFYQGNNALEMLNLDNNFRFQKKFDSIESGIYKLEHLPEYQTLLLEEKDSLWVRINAVAFDASVVFSGIGASKNNFLMELLLKHEAEGEFLSSKYSSNSEIFTSILDSLLLEKKELWIKMDIANSLTPIAQKVTQAAYIYHYATIKERYALLRGAKWDEKKDSLYFKYRTFLNFGDNDLAFFDPYINYILNFISQKALDRSNTFFKQKKTTDFNINRLKILDKIITGPVLRNNLARAIAFEEILTFENHNQHERFLQYYSTVNNSPSYFTEVLTLHANINRMVKNKVLPTVKLQNIYRDTISSSSLTSNKTTVLYFWSQTQMNHYQNSLKRLKKLETNNPHIRFIGICIQPFNSMVDQVQEIMKINLENQFALIDFEKASELWVLTLLNKAIIINEKGNILEGFGNFSDLAFEGLLKKL